MKQKFINSISLLAVCAVLSGCFDPDNKPKSVEELRTEIVRDSQKLSSIAQDALDQAKNKGIPLPLEMQRVLDEDIAGGSTPPPTNAKEALVELKGTLEDIEILKRYGVDPTLWVATLEKVKGLQELLVAAQADNAAARAAEGVAKADAAAKAAEIVVVKAQAVAALAGTREAKDKLKIAQAEARAAKAEAAAAQAAAAETDARIALSQNETAAAKKAVTSAQADARAARAAADMARIEADFAVGAQDIRAEFAAAAADLARAQVAAAKAEAIAARDDTAKAQDELKKANDNFAAAMTALTAAAREAESKANAEALAARAELARTRTALAEATAQLAQAEATAIATRADALAVRAGERLPSSTVDTVAAAAVQELFALPSSEGRGALTISGTRSAFGDVIPIDQNGTSVISLTVDPTAFAGGVANIVEQWLAPAADAGGEVVVSGTPLPPSISTSEAVRQIMGVGLTATHISGAAFAANADPALVAALANIGALEMAQRSEAFRALSSQQQLFALQAALAMANSIRPGDTLALADRFTAVVLAIRELPSGGTFDARMAAVQLQNQGVTNPRLLTDTMRVLTVIAQTSDLGPQDRARILGTVLMINNNSGGVVSDADFSALVSAVRSDPGLLLGENPNQSMPARFTFDPDVLAALISRMASLEALPWSAASSSTAFIQAVGQQVRGQITSGASVDPTSNALVTGLADARRARGGDLAASSSGGVGIFGDSSPSALALAQTIQLLPTPTALNILGAAQDVAVQAASAAREAAMPVLALTDGSSVANVPIDPAVEIVSFMEKYNSLIGSGRHTTLLQELKSNIEAIRRNGNFQRFEGVPDARGTAQMQGLDTLCGLPDKYAKLLYSANDQDELVIPRLVDFILNNNKFASKLEYHTNGVPGTRYPFDRIKGQPLYDTVLAELGAKIDTYLSRLRQAVFDLMYPPASRVEELMAKMLSKGTINSLSDNRSLRQARMGDGSVDLAAFKMNGVSGQSIDLGLPLFVQLKGDVSSAKSTEAVTGSVAYRLGNTVIGAIQGYANSGAGFEADSRQLETSVVASHSFGSFFVEGQIGSVSATDVHNSDWSGVRSQLTLGLDREFVSPFVQVSHRQLDRDGEYGLNDTTAYVGLDMDIAKLAADTYSIDTRLLAKTGYGSKAWSAGSKDLGSTTGFSGSVEWSASLNLNSGVSFGTSLALDTVAGSSAAVNVSLDR